MSYVFRQGDLPKLDLQVDRGTDFKAWKSQWGAYLSLSGLDKEIAAKQVQALTLCFSRETLTIVENLGLTAEQKSDITRTVDAIQRYVDGQINESVERRNFRRRIQQPGESFDDFLIALRELAKTCNFCTDECTQKNLRDQIIAGLVDGDTVESLLQKKELTLETTIAKCRAQEAAKRQRGEITGDNTGVVAAIRQQRRHEKPLTQSRTCPGCGASFHQGGRKHFPAYSLTCHLCGRSGHFAKVCRSRQPPQPLPETAPQPVTSTRAIHAVPQLHTSKVVDTIDPAPTVQVHITSLNGAADIQTLPDSGADISAAGPDALRHLGEHEDNLPSHIIPRAVNGTSMKPIGRLPVTFRLGRQTHVDHLHIYPSVKGVLLSWKTAKSLNILPECYPQPCNTPLVKTLTTAPTSGGIMQEYPTVFDGLIKTMEGEEFHISLTDNAKPFCVNTPRSIPFAYREKLKAELDLLQRQGVIAPVTEPTEWCAPIVVAPKKDT